MNDSANETPTFKADYTIIGPAAMIFAATSIIITSYILIIILSTRQLHTVTRLLTCNTCFASLLFCVTQFIAYTYLLVIKWDTSDQSCRWRGYFGYMSMIAFIYSYLLQVISRFFFIVLSNKYRWLTSAKTHVYMIFITWTVIIILPLPTILTNDIIFRKDDLCWVPKKHKLHCYYLVAVCYIIPILLIIIFNINIFARLYHNRKHTTVHSTTRRHDREYLVSRNIMISFSAYFIGGVPYMLYIFSGVGLLYSMGVVTITFAVNMEKLVIIYLDGELRSMVRNYLCQTNTAVVPFAVNVD
ncbi:unnamed protein product [Adineta ricciae]|uniref:G-protein coupled receptors family 1 profile domain-containing protein n=1 Tax=Adineta ricciae TaxID=249248 RepID=A0A815V0K1_ADIRI|nr:unnamed protein product [Adineta ricciae]CAF1529786.1 unnamed protein product [Adineta ricciae]